MSISAARIVAGSHQQSREQVLGSPCPAGGDPLLCKKSHFNPTCIICVAGFHQCLES